MNHNAKIKNFNRDTAHKKAMFSNMLLSFNKAGFITTTLPKAKAIKPVLESALAPEKIFMVKLPNRKGDNAAMARLVREQYVTNKFTPKTKKSATKKTNTTKETKE
jgi:large subunit ribosomal protein L17